MIVDVSIPVKSTFTNEVLAPPLVKKFFIVPITLAFFKIISENPLYISGIVLFTLKLQLDKSNITIDKICTDDISKTNNNECKNYNENFVKNITTKYKKSKFIQNLNLFLYDN